MGRPFFVMHYGCAWRCCPIFVLMSKLKNVAVPGRHGRPAVVDVNWSADAVKQPLVIFAHGYKGFKDWGIFGRMEEAFAAEGLALLRFNFSHNGGTPEQPIDFPDLEAFGSNNYCIELDDLQSVLDWVEEGGHAFSDHIDLSGVFLIGHSRGGAIATLTAAADQRIRALATWAAVCTLDRSTFQPGPELAAWKATGVMHIKNGRTHQDMPHFIQFYENFIENRERLDVEHAARSLRIPHLIVHGDRDTSVPISHAERLHAWNSDSELLRVAGADHVFGGKHPWEEDGLPVEFQAVLKATLDFFSRPLA